MIEVQAAISIIPIIAKIKYFSKLRRNFYALVRLALERFVNIFNALCKQIPNCQKLSFVGIIEH